MSMRLEKMFRFEAAHWLPGFPEGHKCRRLHGHSYQVRVGLIGDVDPMTGCVMDFGEISKVTRLVEDQLDHRCLNDIDGLENPTSECLAKWIWDRVVGDLPLLADVAVEETCTTRCVYAPSRSTTA